MNRGRLWSLASAGGGYAMGTRASDQMQVLAAMLREGDVVWDIGAHHGYVSLAAARAVGAKGMVHAFEPSAHNASYLRRHLKWNAESRVVPHQFALGAENGTVSFGGGDTSKMHSVGGGGELVGIRRADSLVADGAVKRPDVIKVDVEGGELHVLESLLPILPDTIRGTLAIHSRALADQILARLADTSLTVVQSTPFARMMRSGGWDGDPDLFVFGRSSDIDGALQRKLRALGAVEAA